MSRRTKGKATDTILITAINTYRVVEQAKSSQNREFNPVRWPALSGILHLLGWAVPFSHVNLDSYGPRNHKTGYGMGALTLTLNGLVGGYDFLRVRIYERWSTVSYLVRTRSAISMHTNILVSSNRLVNLLTREWPYDSANKPMGLLQSGDQWVRVL